MLTIPTTCVLPICVQSACLQGEYEVGDILDVRWQGGRHEFLKVIRWKGYFEDHNSWEVRQLATCQFLSLSLSLLLLLLLPLLLLLLLL